MDCLAGKELRVIQASMDWMVEEVTRVIEVKIVDSAHLAYLETKETMENQDQEVIRVFKETEAYQEKEGTKEDEVLMACKVTLDLQVIINLRNKFKL